MVPCLLSHPFLNLPHPCFACMSCAPAMVFLGQLPPCRSLAPALSVLVGISDPLHSLSGGHPSVRLQPLSLLLPRSAHTRLLGLSVPDASCAHRVGFCSSMLQHVLSPARSSPLPCVRAASSPSVASRFLALFTGAYLVSVCTSRFSILAASFSLWSLAVILSHGLRTCHLM